jgi:hypothetical protein
MSLSAGNYFADDAASDFGDLLAFVPGQHGGPLRGRQLYAEKLTTSKAHVHYSA